MISEDQFLNKLKCLIYNKMYASYKSLWLHNKKYY